MGQYSEGWITVPGKGKRWRNTDGDYSRLRPGFGSQTLGATGVAIQNMFRSNKVRAFPDTFKDEYDADPSYAIDEVVIKPSKSKPTPTEEITTPTEQITTPTRDVQKADGSKGTQTSPGGGRPILDAAGAQAFYQSVGLGGFLSTQLPGTGANPDNKGTIEAVPFGGQETSITTNTLGAFSDTDGNAFINLNPKLNPEYFTNPNPELMKAIGSTFNQYGELAQGNGAPTTATQGTKQAGEKGQSRIMEALNDTDGINSYMSKFGSPEQDRMRAANRAFLNDGDSMEGLRAKEHALGMIYAGGNHYQLNEGRTDFIKGEDGNPKAADKKATRAFKAGTMSAEDYIDSFKEEVKKVAAGNDGPITPKAGENPFAQMPAPATTAFPTDIPAGTFAPASTEIGEMIDTVRGMDMTPPISSQQISDSFLNKREPLMRDPRKK